MTFRGDEKRQESLILYQGACRIDINAHCLFDLFCLPILYAVAEKTLA